MVVDDRFLISLTGLTNDSITLGQICVLLFSCIFGFRNARQKRQHSAILSLQTTKAPENDYFLLSNFYLSSSPFFSLQITTVEDIDFPPDSGEEGLMLKVEAC